MELNASMFLIQLPKLCAQQGIEALHPAKEILLLSNLMETKLELLENPSFILTGGQNKQLGEAKLFPEKEIRYMFQKD